MQSNHSGVLGHAIIVPAKETYWQKCRKHLDRTQLFFLILSIPFLIIAPYCLSSILEVVEIAQSSRPDYEGPMWSDFLLLFITLPFITLLKHLMFLMFSGYYERNLPSKYQGQIRELKIEKGCENIFKSAYFIAISIYGYFAVIRQLPFDIPIFGNGSWHNYFDQFPYTPFFKASTYY